MVSDFIDYPDRFIEEYETPFGKLTQTFIKGYDRLREDGELQTEYFVKSFRDLLLLIYFVLDQADTPCDSIVDTTFLRQDSVGVNHVVVGCEFMPSIVARGMLGLEMWSYAQYDWPLEYFQLLKAIKLRDRQAVSMAQLLRPGTILLFVGIEDNISLDDYLDNLPVIRFYAETLHENGVRVGIHAHGKHLKHYSEVIKKIKPEWIESYTPPPYSDLTLRELRSIVGENTFIWINFPEAVFYSGEKATYEYTKDLLQGDSNPNRAIGFSEMGFMGVDDRNRKVFENGTNAIFDAIEKGF